MGKILVTGATGQLGYQEIQFLLETVPAADLAILARDRAHTRDPEKWQAIKERGVEIREGDYDHYGTLVKAFQGVDKLYFIASSDLANRAAQHERVVGAAAEARVGHIFYTSFQRKTEGDTSPIAFMAEAHLKTEQWIRESGLTYTILEHALYTDILPMFMGDYVLESRAIFLPAGQGKASFAARQDIAAAEAAILTGSGHENKVYELSGSQSFSFQDIADILSELSGKDIRYLTPSPEEFTAELTKGGVPAEAVQGVAGICTAIAQGEFDCPNTTLERWLGRRPVSVRDYLKMAYGL
jgi:NAD(P)H dehydrogenase (quinone)